MKTWVTWTHYDCDVYVSLAPSLEQAYLEMKNDWLDSCGDDCGHDPETTDIQEISRALAYHYEELSYEISERDVPVVYSTPESVAQDAQAVSQWVTTASAGTLMARLETFSEEP